MLNTIIMIAQSNNQQLLCEKMSDMMTMADKYEEMQKEFSDINAETRYIWESVLSNAVKNGKITFDEELIETIRIMISFSHFESEFSPSLAFRQVLSDYFWIRNIETGSSVNAYERNMTFYCRDENDELYYFGSLEYIVCDFVEEHKNIISLEIFPDYTLRPRSKTQNRIILMGRTNEKTENGEYDIVESVALIPTTLFPNEELMISPEQPK